LLLRQLIWERLRVLVRSGQIELLAVHVALFVLAEGEKRRGDDRSGGEEDLRGGALSCTSEEMQQNGVSGLQMSRLYHSVQRASNKSRSPHVRPDKETADSLRAPI
jgi:hypothetical protein